MLYRSTKGGGKAVNFEEAILAGYAPDGLGSSGAIKNAKQNQWTWNVSSSSIAYDSSNPPSYREFEKSLEPFQKR